MDFVEPEDKSEETAHAKEQSKGRLNTLVAVTVALLATFMGICKVKDDNIVQQMQRDQAKAVDAWGWYQAKKTRAMVARGNIDQFEVQATASTPAQRLIIEAKIGGYANEIQKLNAEMKDLEQRARDFESDYDAWNLHDDQFDLADALLSISISLLAVTSLTQKRWLYIVAIIPMLIGVVFGMAGLLHLGLHSDFFAKWLGT